MHLKTVLTALVLTCLIGGSSAAQDTNVPTTVRTALPIEIVPVADHHQHVVGPGALAMVAQAPALPAIKLPQDLDKVLRARERASGTDDLSLFTSDAQILDISEAEDHWVRGADGVKRMIGAYEQGTPLVPLVFHRNGNAGYIAGVVGDRAPANPTMQFMLGLRKDLRGAWKIAVEYATIKPPLEFSQPLTADRTIQVLDDAGIKRAAVISVAYWLGDGAFKGTVSQEYNAVKSENDWMAAQVARFPDRLVGFCGVNPLSDYALDEIRRCAKLPLVRGMKLHFANSRVDVTNPQHVQKLRAFLREANTNRMAIIAHLWVMDRSYGPNHARIFINDILPEAPDVTVQIAHLAGAGRYAYDSVTAVFADAVMAGDPRMKNVYFDLATVVNETLDVIAKRLRQLGLEKILFGADTPAGSRPDPILAWATLKRRLPMTEREMRQIAGNVAPYLR